MARRRIKEANIRFISLCPAGANQIPVLYKSETDVFAFDTIVKAEMDKGEITAVVYAPEIRDSQGDIADAAAIRKMAHGFLRDGEGIDLMHNGEPLSKDDAHVAESFIIQKGDARFAGIKNSKGVEIDPTDAWAVVIKIDNEDIRKLYREGKWQGVSMGGTGLVAVEKKGPRNQRLLRQITDHLGITQPRVFHSTTISGEIDMTPAELKKTLDDNATSQAETITKGIVAGLKPLLMAQADENLCKAAGVEAGDTDEVKAAKIVVFKAKGGKAPAQTTEQTPTQANPGAGAEPIFKGDFSDEHAVAMFEYERQVWEIKKDVDPKDPAAVRKAQEALKKLTKPEKAKTEGKDGELSADDLAAKIVKTDSDELRAAKRKVHALEKSSNQTPGGQQPPKTGEGGLTFTGLTKEEEAGRESGERMARFLNPTKAKTGTHN